MVIWLHGNKRLAERDRRENYAIACISQHWKTLPKKIRVAASEISLSSLALTSRRRRRPKICFTFTSIVITRSASRNGCFMAIFGRYEPCRYSIKSISIYFYHYRRQDVLLERHKLRNWYPRNLLSLSVDRCTFLVLLNQTGSRWNPLLNAAKVDWRLKLFFFWKLRGEHRTCWFCLSRLLCNCSPLYEASFCGKSKPWLVESFITFS